MGTPLTAHFLGGCPIGDSAESGVIDPYHRLYGHPGISVVDGSAVSANLGVNPSLTITAQAERAMSLLAQQGRGRPAARRRARRTCGWPPSSRGRPAVPEDAFGALRLPLLASRGAARGEPRGKRGPRGAGTCAPPSAGPHPPF